MKGINDEKQIDRNTSRKKKTNVKRIQGLAELQLEQVFFFPFLNVYYL